MRKLLAATAIVAAGATAASASNEMDIVAAGIQYGLSNGNYEGSYTEILAQGTYVGILNALADAGEWNYQVSPQVCETMTVDGYAYVSAGSGNVPQGILDWAENDGHVSDDFEAESLISYAVNAMGCGASYKVSPSGEVMLAMPNN